MNPITLVDKTWDNARCEEWFCKNLTHELGIGGAKDIGQIDMVRLKYLKMRIIIY